MLNLTPEEQVIEGSTIMNRLLGRSTRETIMEPGTVTGRVVVRSLAGNRALLASITKGDKS